MTIATNLQNIEDRIVKACERAGRNRESVTLVGVSKKKPWEAIVEALETTQLRDFGENYVQEYVEKREILGEREAVWHLIGHLQRNKVRALMAFPPELIHSVDSVSLAEQLERVTGEMYPEYRQKILIELRIGDEEGEKTGLSPKALPEMMNFLKGARHLDVKGLMLIPPESEAPEGARPYFRKVREIRDELVREYGISLDILSYGMSHDFEIAIEEGATHVRIGTAIFGARA